MFNNVGFPRRCSQRISLVRARPLIRVVNYYHLPRQWLDTQNLMAGHHVNPLIVEAGKVFFQGIIFRVQRLVFGSV